MENLVSIITALAILTAAVGLVIAAVKKGGGQKRAGGPDRPDHRVPARLGRPGRRGVSRGKRRPAKKGFGPRAGTAAARRGEARRRRDRRDD